MNRMRGGVRMCVSFWQQAGAMTEYHTKSLWDIRAGSLAVYILSLFTSRCSDSCLAQLTVVRFYSPERWNLEMLGRGSIHDRFETEEDSFLHSRSRHTTTPPYPGTNGFNNVLQRLAQLMGKISLATPRVRPFLVPFLLYTAPQPYNTQHCPMVTLLVPWPLRGHSDAWTCGVCHPLNTRFLISVELNRPDSVCVNVEKIIIRRVSLKM